MKYSFAQPGMRQWWETANFLFNQKLGDHVEQDLLKEDT